VLEPSAVSVAGLKLHETNVGNPAQVNVIDPV
jgi:hypothetical protein